MIVRVIAPAAFLLAVGGMAAGASASPSTSPAPNSPAGQPGQAAATPQQAQPTTINIVAANQVVGRSLRDPGGADVGTIQSLVIDTRTGVVDFVLVGSSGSANNNGGVVAVPWLALEPPASGNGPIATKISADKIQHSPRINPTRVNELNQAGQRSRIYGYYGYRYPGYYRRGYGYAYGPYGYGPGGAGYGPGPGGYGPYPGPGPRPVGTARQGAGRSGNRAGPNTAQQNNTGPNGPANSAPQTQAQQNTPQTNAEQANAQQASQNGSALVVTRDAVISTLNQRGTTSANALQNASVYGRYGQSIGDIDEVMIDADRGEVAFVLLSRGGFLGLNQRWYTLPVEALVPAPYQGGYRLTVNAETLLQEPTFNVDRQNLPTHVSASQLASLYQRFGMKPYWEQNGQPSPQSSTASQNQGQPPGGQSVGQSGASNQPGASK